MAPLPGLRNQTNYLIFHKVYLQKEFHPLIQTNKQKGDTVQKDNSSDSF